VDGAISVSANFAKVSRKASECRQAKLPITLRNNLRKLPNSGRRLGRLTHRRRALREQAKAHLDSFLRYINQSTTARQSARRGKVIAWID